MLCVRLTHTSQCACSLAWHRLPVAVPRGPYSLAPCPHKTCSSEDCISSVLSSFFKVLYQHFLSLFVSSSCCFWPFLLYLVFLSILLFLFSLLPSFRFLPHLLLSFSLSVSSNMSSSLPVCWLGYFPLMFSVWLIHNEVRQENADTGFSRISRLPLFHVFHPLICLSFLILYPLCIIFSFTSFASNPPFSLYTHTQTRELLFNLTFHNSWNFLNEEEKDKQNRFCFSEG